MIPIRLLFLLILPGVVACAGEKAYQRGQELIASGQVSQGLGELKTATKEAPGNHQFRKEFNRQKEIQIAQMLSQADNYRQAGQSDEADVLYRKVQEVDLHNERAAAGLIAIDTERRHRTRAQEASLLFKAGKADAAELVVRGILAENPNQREARTLRRQISEQTIQIEEFTPKLKSSLSKSVSLELKDAQIKSVFELLTRASGVNFILDKEVKPDARASLSIKENTVEDVIRLVLATNQLDYKVLNDNTILVFPNTQNKMKDYKDLVVRIFYLTNADVKQVANTIKTLVKTKDIVIDEKLNFLVMRDTPEAVRIAERLVAAQDLPDSEVLLELEVLEISASRLMDLGIRYPEQIGYSLIGADNIPGTVRLPEWQNRNSNLVRMAVSNPAVLVNLRKIDSDTNLLANPRIRVRNRDKAKIHIGERVPVITTTSTANVGVSEAVSYLDVGLKLEVEPTIALNDDVSIKIGLEVSNILETITRASGLQTYRLGTRNATTALRLRDGETQVLAGLIQDDDRKSTNKVPGLGDIPLLGKLFSNRNGVAVKTEIVLLITPRIVRNLDPIEGGSAIFQSGTEATIGAPPLRLRQPPAKPQPGATAASEVDAQMRAGAGGQQGEPAAPSVGNSASAHPDEAANEPAAKAQGAPSALVPSSSTATTQAALPLPDAFIKQPQEAGPPKRESKPKAEKTP